MPHLLPATSTEPLFKRILVVEDDVALRLVLANWLRSLKYDVVEAASADEAVILLEAGYVIDFVITDVQMPGTMDGFGLVRYVNEAFPLLNIMVVSGDDHFREPRNSNFYFLKKPFSLKHISTCVAELLLDVSRLNSNSDE